MNVKVGVSVHNLDKSLPIMPEFIDDTSRKVQHHRPFYSEGNTVKTRLRQKNKRGGDSELFSWLAKVEKITAFE